MQGELRLPRVPPESPLLVNRVMTFPEVLYRNAMQLRQGKKRQQSMEKDGLLRKP